MNGISFIVPVYNGEKTIEECIRSILSQNLICNLEVIVVENGSTDKTMHLLHKFPDIKVIVEPRRGRSRARNSGAEAAQFSNLAFIDCDVVLSPHWANQILKALRNPYGAVQTPIVVKSRNRSEELYYLNPVSQFQTIDSAAMMISKEVFYEIGGFSEEFPCWEDSELTIRLMSHGYGLMVVSPCMAMKYENRSLWEICKRAFRVGRVLGGAMKSWSGKKPVGLKDLVIFLAKNASLTGFFQVLGSIFFSSDFKCERSRKRGWLRIDEELVISRQLLSFVAPHFITLKSACAQFSFTIRDDHPQFEVLLTKVYNGNSIIEDILKLAHSSELNSLILRRYSS